MAVLDGRKLSASATALDKLTRGAITKAIKASSFKGAKNHSLTIMTPAGTRLERILCVGMGKPKDLDERAFETIGGRIYANLKAQSEKAHILLDGMDGCKLSVAEMAVSLFAIERGYLDDVAINKVVDFEHALISHVRSKFGDTLWVAGYSGGKLLYRSGKFISFRRLNEHSKWNWYVEFGYG